ncbi:hypothetical protein SLITK23_00730 [Streptomyces lividans]|nr:hypothetical protein SLITK23_00730 [Streptomyces lividans]
MPGPAPSRGEPPRLGVPRAPSLTHGKPKEPNAQCHPSHSESLYGPIMDLVCDKVPPGFQAAVAASHIKPSCGLLG